MYKAKLASHENVILMWEVPSISIQSMRLATLYTEHDSKLKTLLTFITGLQYLDNVPFSIFHVTTEPDARI